MHRKLGEKMRIYEAPFRGQAGVRDERRDALSLTVDADFRIFVDLVEIDGRSAGFPPMDGNLTIHRIEFVDFGISQVSRITYALNNLFIILASLG